MNPKDEIVEEVRAAREAHAARFNYVLGEMFNDLIAKEQARKRSIAKLRLWNRGPPRMNKSNLAADERG